MHYMRFLFTARWLDFPGNRGECIDCITNDFAPTNVVEIIPGFQVPYKTHHQCVQEDRPYLSNFRQVKKYFPERSVDLRFGGDAGKQMLPVPSTMRAVCRHLQRIVREPIGQLGDHRYEQLQTAGAPIFHPRVILIGRRGAGRKTQGALLAHKLGAVFSKFYKFDNCLQFC